MLTFIKQYLLHPRSVGAVAPSGQALAEQMMSPIDFSKAKTIVEYGPGTGAFTRELCARRRTETRLILIERNETFFRGLLEAFRSEGNLTLIHGSAEDAAAYLQRLGISEADYVVSGLPFASLPEELTRRVFRATQRILGEQGSFITFQYTLVKERYFRRFFDLEQKLYVRKNLPPAYVFVCKHKFR